MFPYAIDGLLFLVNAQFKSFQFYFTTLSYSSSLFHIQKLLSVTSYVNIYVKILTVVIFQNLPFTCGPSTSQTTWSWIPFILSMFWVLLFVHHCYHFLYGFHYSIFFTPCFSPIFNILIDVSVPNSSTYFEKRKKVRYNCYIQVKICLCLLAHKNYIFKILRV